MSENAQDADLFISYAEADRAWVEGYLLDALTRAGVRCHSEATFALGVPRLEEFERAIQRSRRTVLVLSSAAAADGFAQFAQLLAQSYGAETATWPVIPLLRTPVKLPPRLAMLTALDATKSDRWPHVIERLCVESQRPVPDPTPRPPCPYPGMVPFSANDARFFYGRTAEIQQMLQHLRHERYLFVIGPSGSGKSSLVSGGLLPQLPESSYFPPGFWLVQEMRPGGQPLHSLAQTLGGDPAQPAQALADLLAAHPPAQRLLLVVDQFEELFTQAGHSEQNRFIAALKGLRTVESCALLLALRADFYPDLMNSDLWPVDPSQRLEISPLRGEALRQAIKRPAEDVGVYLEAGLLERLLADAAEEPGVLPLVQETMALLWDKMERRLLPRLAYEQLSSDVHSGLAVAMTKKADATLAALSEAQQKIARRIFLRLVQFGSGRTDTRRQQTIAALRSPGDDPLLFDQTLRRLAENRLLTLTGAEDDAEKKVDIAHEMLIIGWPTSRKWVQSRREAELARRRLQAKAEEWQRLGRSGGGLLDDVELLEAERWLASPDAVDLGQDEVLLPLVQASRARIEADQALARRRVRRTIAALAVGLILVAGLALWGGISARNASVEAANARRHEKTALDERDRAAEQRRIALARQLAAQAELVRNHEPRLLELSVLLAVESMRRFPAPEAALPLAQGADLLPRRDASRLYVQAVNAMVFSPDGRYLATASGDLTSDERATVPQGDNVRVWEVASGREVAHMSHEKGAGAVIFSRDGKLLASGSPDKTARVWEVATGREVARATCDGSVNAVAFSPNGTYVCAGSLDSTARVWEAASGREVLRVAHEVSIDAVAFSPNGKYLATASNTITYAANSLADIAGRVVVRLPVLGASTVGLIASPPGQGPFLAASALIRTRTPPVTARIWDVASGTEVARLTHQGGVDGIVFSPDGKYLATASQDQTARVWEVATGREIARMTHEGSVQAVAFSPDGKYVASASGHLLLSSKDHTARVWEAASGREVMRVTHPTIVSAVAFSPDGKYLATASQDQTARLWEVATGREIARMTHEGSVKSVAFSPVGTCLASAGHDGIVKLWKTANHHEVARMPHREYVLALAFSRDGQRLATACLAGTGKVWEIETGREVGRLPHGDKASGIYERVLSPDGRYVATTSAEPVVRVWKVPEDHEVARIANEPAAQYFAFNSDGRYLAIVSNDKTMRVCEVASAKEVARVISEAAVRSVALSPEGEFLAAACTDGTARVWKLPGGREIVRLAHGPEATNVAFSPDGKYLATAGGDRMARLWEITSGCEVVRMPHEYPLQAIAFSSDGRYLATAGHRTARVWELFGGRELIRIMHELDVDAIAFSPDGKLLATASGDMLSPEEKLVRLWLWRPEDLIARACSRLTRNLAWEEWRQYLGDEEYRKTVGDLPVHPSVILGLVDRAMSLVRGGDAEAASLDYAKAVEWAIETDEPFPNNYACWRGSINGFAKIVLPAGEHAVKLAPDNGEVHDTRGLARALTGDYRGAVEDFKFYVGWAKEKDGMRETERRKVQRKKRQAWIAELEAGRNPFDPATLEALWDD